MSTFIRNHIVEKIRKEARTKKKLLSSIGFLYFDTPINSKGRILNRINDFFIYEKEEVVPTKWHLIDATSLLQIYSDLKDNKFFTYNSISGKSHKIRPKKHDRSSKARF
jgi:hypothetical protein